MASKLQELQGNEALLLMYLAGELSADQRTEVDRRLAEDETLAGELLRLRELASSCNAAFHQADSRLRLPVTEAVVIRRISRAIHDRQVRRLTAGAASEAKRGVWFPWWAYPVAVAASIIIGFLVWSANQKMDRLAPGTDYLAQAEEDERQKALEFIGRQFDTAPEATVDLQPEQVSLSGDDDAYLIFFKPVEGRPW